MPFFAFVHYLHQNPYYEVIADLLSDDSKQTFYYMRVLWQYLTDNHGLQCSQSTFRAYINRKPEFRKYFVEGKRIASSSPGKVRFETPPGEQAQLDWKGFCCKVFGVKLKCRENGTRRRMHGIF
ncbi:hypothetical protein BK750_22820 [Bacillus thuringiensis serovar jegathesan]|uniref:Uncharacterized protein n=1 Tax=Bacillus thuringiensis subsp. jegathesan TaxID=56955 RepID=A0A9X6QX15_BACTJ|nr:hypothetical protein BK750_22820 [Bacillus thuringiensis serovar jegathesan]